MDDQQKSAILHEFETTLGGDYKEKYPDDYAERRQLLIDFLDHPENFQLTELSKNLLKKTVTISKATRSTTLTILRIENMEFSMYHDQITGMRITGDIFWSDGTQEKIEAINDYPTSSNLCKFVERKETVESVPSLEPTGP